MLPLTLLTASDPGSFSILILLAAFNTTDHNSLLLPQKHLVFGILLCPASILTCKVGTQVLTVNEVKSSPSLLTCGVPQGSVLGPVLFILYTQPLSGVISHHSVSHHMFADDTELYKSDSFEVFTLAQTIESCVSDVKVWAVQNKLQSNDDKTEICLIGSAPRIDLPSSLCVGHSDIPFSSAACNLGVILTASLH